MKPPKEGLHAKLKRYEELLNQYGAKVGPSDNGDSSDEETSSRLDLEMADASPSSSKSQPGPFEETKANIIHKDGSSRYFERHVSLSFTMLNMSDVG